jgi:hypothetical protein
MRPHHGDTGTQPAVTVRGTLVPPLRCFPGSVRGFPRWYEGDSRGFIGHPVEAGSQVTRDGLGAVGAHRSGLIYFALKSHAVTR